MKHFLLGVLVLLAADAHAADPATKPDAGEALTTTDGVRFGLWPKRPEKPAPILFALSGSQEDTLGSSYFRQSGHYLAAEGVVCVSIDLPCHGLDSRPGESGLGGWRKRCDKGDDFVAEVTGRLSRVLDHLIQEGIADPQRIAALGTSRGGFIAAHFAMADARVKHVMLFAPVTDLAMLKEFDGAEKDPLVRNLALTNKADALAGKSLWLVIGDRDERVSTDSAIRFARTVTQTTLAAPEPASVDFHIIAEPRGHTVPPGYAELGADWLRKKFEIAPAK